MSQAIEQAKRPIVMKNGLVLWVTEDTATKVEAHLVNQKQHSFMKLTELGMTINTAEIQGVYTPKEYDAIQKQKQGLWQCTYQEWHKKTEQCYCLQERKKQEREDTRRKQQQADLAPPTPEQQARNKEMLQKHSEELALRGIIKRKEIRRSTIMEFEKKGIPIKVDLSTITIDEDIL